LRLGDLDLAFLGERLDFLFGDFALLERDFRLGDFALLERDFLFGDCLFFEEAFLGERERLFGDARLGDCFLFEESFWGDACPSSSSVSALDLNKE
jgi:hypothetical protein